MLFRGQNGPMSYWMDQNHKYFTQISAIKLPIENFYSKLHVLSNFFVRIFFYLDPTQEPVPFEVSVLKVLYWT